MGYIYIIKCKNNKYYIGFTKSKKYSIQNQIDRNIIWTKLHKPLEIIEYISNCSKSDLEKYIIKYMALYGIDSTRGGNYNTTILNIRNMEAII